MTPAARLQAAIEILDQILVGKSAEQQLTAWGRRSRFAGSKDRAAVRDHVFQSLRCLRSYAVLGGAETGRGLILGLLRHNGEDPADFFTGEGHAPSELTPSEMEPVGQFSSEAEELDIPEWLWNSFSQSLGQDAPLAAAALQGRAPVHLRVNRLKGTLEAAQKALAQEDIDSAAHPASPWALEVTSNARRLRNSQAFLSGLVELQDAASQAVIDVLPLEDGMKVLDLCAGGGGKSLAMAAAAKLKLFAHDIEQKRMKDIPNRAKRAGARVTCLATEQLAKTGPYDLVLCDAPCSGSGSWRRAPEGKWNLSRERLDEIKALQTGIFDHAAQLITATGTLAYATCSMLAEENEDQVEAFLARHSGWSETARKSWKTHDGTDGFFVSVLTRATADC